MLKNAYEIENDQSCHVDGDKSLSYQGYPILCLPAVSGVYRVTRLDLLIKIGELKDSSIVPKHSLQPICLCQQTHRCLLQFHL